MPNGAYPAGIDLSLKPPAVGTMWKVESNTSTVPSWKLVAYRNVPASLVAIVRPLYTAVGEENSSCAAVRHQIGLLIVIAWLMAAAVGLGRNCRRGRGQDDAGGRECGERARAHAERMRH